MGSIPSRYLVFDTETKETLLSSSPKKVRLDFRLGVAKLVHRESSHSITSTYLDYTNPLDLFTLIDGLPFQKDTLFVFAHNLGFDLRINGLIPQIGLGRYSLLNPNPSPRRSTEETPFFVLDDPPTIISCYRPDGQRIMWLDTWQWLSSSLKKIGDIMGFPKGTMPPLSAPLAEWFPYCRQDVDVLDAALLKIFAFLESIGVKSFHPTRAGQARLIYSQRYEKKRITYHQDPLIQAVERPSYYGGFTECFFVGSVPHKVHQLDVNSLYPYVMSKYWYPCAVRSVQLSEGHSTSIVAKNPKRMIAEVFLDSKLNAYPVRSREGTIFARGKLRTILSGPELEAAFQAGDVHHTTRYVDYEVQPLFGEFVKDFYALRLKAKSEGNEVFDYMYKLMLNSLYGKFGQQTSEWKYIFASDPPDKFAQYIGPHPETGLATDYRVMAGCTYRRTEEFDHPRSFVAIASFVTAYAREHMRSLRSHLDPRGVYYQATDSLYVDTANYNILKSKNLIDPDTLGSLKDEGSYPSLSIVNIHNMDKGDRKIRGSIRSKAVDLGDETYRVERWEKLSAGVRAGNLDCVHIEDQIKRLTHRYDRQIVTASGFTVPHRVNNWHVPPSTQRNQPLYRSSLQPSS